MNGTDATALMILSLRLDASIQNSRLVLISSKADSASESRMKESILNEYTTLLGRVTFSGKCNSRWTSSLTQRLLITLVLFVMDLISLTLTTSCLLSRSYMEWQSSTQSTKDPTNGRRPSYPSDLNGLCTKRNSLCENPEMGT